MPTKERAADRGSRRATDTLRAIGRELRDARIAADLGQRQLGNAVGVSASEISRIERGLVRAAPITILGAMAAVLGLDLSVRLYPVALPLRDRAQVALLEAFRSRLHATLGWQAEAPLPIAGDLRAWDASIRGRGWCVWVDAETRIRDAQALIRRTSLKARDSGEGIIVLVVADTRSNRAVLRAIGTSLVDNAVPGAEIMRALESGQRPAGNGVVLI